MNRRSEERKVAEYNPTPEEVETLGWKKLVHKARHPHVAANSGDNEWYTPPNIIDAVTATLGTIQLDPASSDIANQTVKAQRYYTQADNGLQQRWIGKTYMNPPYAANLIDKFIDKYVCHIIDGDIPEGICLTNNATDTQWFSTLTATATALCLPVGRIRYHKPDGELGAPLQGQAITYHGTNPAKFLHYFMNMGRVWR